jgi:hypothetical protein
MPPFDRAWNADAELRAEAERLRDISLDSFYAFMPAHNYIHVPTRLTWPASSVNARLAPIDTGRVDEAGKAIKISASTWLDQNRPVEQMSWAPGLPMLIRDQVILDGGWKEEPGCTCFNLYLPPTVIPGDPYRAAPWVGHIRLIYPDDAEQILNWLAHRVQRPDEKINHALVLGGEPGIGKDSLLEPVKQAIGPWNFQEASPTQVLGRFNGFARAVILRISEARDLGSEFDRFQFYEHMKWYIAAPPDTLRVDEKNLREYSIPNVCGVVVTTNHKTDGIHLPAEDRRHYVAWSGLTKEDSAFCDNYWNRLWRFYADGGFGHVAAYLVSRDISGFDAKEPPPKTEAFWAIVDANRAPEVSEVADLLDVMGEPDAFTVAMLVQIAEKPSATDGGFIDWLKERKNRRAIPHRLENCGYTPVRNPDAPRDGLWQINRKRQAVYAKSSLSLRDQLSAARKLL